MAGRVRRYTFVGVSACCALAFGVLSLAPADLAGGLLPAGSGAATSTAMGDMAFGVTGIVLVAPGFASQVVRRTVPAAMHQVAMVGVALAAASVWSGEVVGLAGAAAVLLAVGAVWTLHPDRDALLPRASESSPSRLMLGLALAVSVPAWWSSSVLAARGRADLPPEDSFAFVPSFWSALVALFLATSLLALLAGSRVAGWPVPAGCVAAAAFLFGVASIVNPEAPASGGRVWGVAVVAWSGAWVLAARVARRAQVISGSS